MNLYSLVGRNLKITDRIKNSNGGGVITTKRKWLVVASYPHHVLCIRTCENGAEIRECFNEGTLIASGIIKTKIDHTYNKNYLNGWGL